MQRIQTISGSLALACLLIGTAILLFSDPTGWLRVYGGDAMATALIYFLLRLTLPQAGAWVPALTLLIALCLELGQTIWYPLTGQTGISAIIFGATFDWVDIAIYTGTVVACVLLEKRWIMKS